MSTKTETLRVRVPAELARQVDARAEAEGVTRSQAIRRAIENMPSCLERLSGNPDVFENQAALIFGNHDGDKERVAAAVRDLLPIGLKYAAAFKALGQSEEADRVQAECLMWMAALLRRGHEDAAPVLEAAQLVFSPEAVEQFRADQADYSRRHFVVVEG